MKLTKIKDVRPVLFGLATLSVVLFHTYDLEFRFYILNILRGSGDIGVEIFLFLSGVGLFQSMINGEADHIHLLVSAPPQICLANVINSLKSSTSRLVRKKYAEHLAKFYWKPYFWNRSYLILSSGGAPIEVIRKYIQDQGEK